MSQKQEFSLRVKLNRKLQSIQTRVNRLSTLAAVGLVVLISSLLLTTSSSGSDMCHLRELDICIVGAASLLQNPNGLPISQAEIERQCEYMQESTDCFSNYASKCMTERQGMLLAWFSSDFMQVQKDMCSNETAIRQDYVKKATCLREVQRKHQRACASDLQAGFASLHKLNRTTRWPTSCCNLNRFKDCIMNPIQTECGDEATEIVETIVGSLTGPILTVGCRNYDPASAECVRLLPEVGARTHMGRNTSALSRIIGSYTNVQP